MYQPTAKLPENEGGRCIARVAGMEIVNLAPEVLGLVIARAQFIGFAVSLSGAVLSLSGQPEDLPNFLFELRDKGYV